MSIIRQGIGTLLSRSATHGGTVYLQGMTADDKSLDIQGQTRQVLDKIDRALAEAGTDKSHILSAMIYISDIALRPRMNEVYVAWIDPRNPPTRACVGVQLEGNTLLEIIVVAASKS
jgi:enamine deaminase RidA (YjgF/YER057c/UK114 family)